MKAPIKIGLLSGMRTLYVERHANHWVLPVNTDRSRSYGQFIRLYDDGHVTKVHKSNEPPYEEEWLIKPADNV